MGVHKSGRDRLNSILSRLLPANNLAVFENVVHQSGPVNPGSGQSIIIQANDRYAGVTGDGLNELPDGFIRFGTKDVKNRFHVNRLNRKTFSYGWTNCALHGVVLFVDNGSAMTVPRRPNCLSY